ncbi:zinc finger protein 254 [Helicoverpa armigera]|uniref:zinc finger protein 254 n=1 Tax=Helicoverpa armigera TaxID=29058 RepID=UPI003082D6F1
MCDEDEAFCRLCAEPTNKETLISPDDDVGINSKIASKLSWINIDVSTTDTLPKSICYSCFDLLERTWSFLHNVRTAQTKLNEIFLKKDDKENLCSEVKNLQNNEGKPVNMDWEDFQDVKRDVKPEICEELQIVDPNSLLELASVKVERISAENILQNSDGFRSTDSDAPLYMSVKKKKLKKKKKLRYNSDLDTENNANEIEQGASLTWDEYMCRCADCDAQCKNIMSLRLHALHIHSRCCTFKCSDCGKVVNNYKSFVNHVRTHKKLLRYCCEFCNKLFTMAAYLKKHRNTSHSNAYRLTCQNCGSVFENEELLQDHIILYAKPFRKRAVKCEKEYELKCEHCNKEFKSRSNLQQHKLVHTERSRDFSCHICGKMFFTKGTLSTHMMTHEDTKPFKCEFCQMTFRARGNLQSHISLHSGAKPFVCEQCGKSFRVKRHLKSHSIVHTDLMPYVCEYCNKTFRFKTRLNLHLRQHTGAKPYKCIYCQRDFTNGSNFKKHMKRRHNIDTSRRRVNIVVENDRSIEASDAEANQT